MRIFLSLVGILSVGIFAYWMLNVGAVHEPPAGGSTPLQRGQDIFYGKGRCGLCHTIGLERGGKCPNLDGAGDRLTRDFVYEAMTQPEAYVKLDYDPPEPKRYPAKMPVINRSPVGLTETEMAAVMSFVLDQR